MVESFIILAWIVALVFVAGVIWATIRRRPRNNSDEAVKAVIITGTPQPNRRNTTNG